MTTVALTAPLLRGDLLHFLGYRGRGAPGPRTEAMLGPALAEARGLIAPRGVHRVVPAECAAALGLEPRSGSSLALGLVTIGFELERRVSKLLADGEATRALLLDAAGSAAAEEAAEDMERRIHGGGAPRRFSPGYGSWPITAQRALFELLPHEDIEVRLLPSCLMTPRKSVSFALWLGAKDGVGAGEGIGARDATAAGDECRLRRCSTCDMETCPYREESEASG